MTARKSRRRKSEPHPAAAAVELCRQFNDDEHLYAFGCRQVLAACEARLGLPPDSMMAADRQLPTATQRRCRIAAEAFVAANAEIVPALAALATAHAACRAAVSLSAMSVAGPVSLLRQPGAGLEYFPGVFYTPPDLALRLCRGIRASIGDVISTVPRVLDPAVGCGELLLAWLEASAPVENALGASNTLARRRLAAEMHGWDIDPIAVAIARSRVLCACAEDSGRINRNGTAELTDLRARLAQQIRVADGLLEASAAGFDVVIANPPFQFLSGKHSPVAALKRTEPALAAKLAARHAALAARYPTTSQGCRDLYKWFIEAALAQTRSDGWLGLITPNTWLYLHHFRDVRRLLVEHTRIEGLWDLGFGAFAGATLGTAVVWAQRTLGTPAVPPRQVIRLEAGRTARRAVAWRAGDFEVFRSSFARELYNRPDLVTLGDLTDIAEGEHGLRREGLESRTVRSRTFAVPIVADEQLCALTPPPVRWWPAAVGDLNALAGRRAAHCGPRLFIRKTGMGLLAAPAPERPDCAWAHQNLYILRPVAAIPPHWLVLWLTAEPVQRLYREGPHGQPGRPLAQLRVAYLRRLPVPPVECWQTWGPELERLWRERPGASEGTSELASAWVAWQARLTALVEALMASPESANGRRLASNTLRAAGSAVH